MVPLDVAMLAHLYPSYVVASAFPPAGFSESCLPTKSPQPPIGTAWIHEIKHDGIRVIARKTELGVRLCSRPGNDLAQRFPLIADALARLRARSCILDDEGRSC
jgi:bifunctional non-homologous end joining protein LigD